MSYACTTGEAVYGERVIEGPTCQSVTVAVDQRDQLARHDHCDVARRVRGAILSELAMINVRSGPKTTVDAGHHRDDARDIGQIPARPVIPAEIQQPEGQRQDDRAAEKMQSEGFQSELHDFRLKVAVTCIGDSAPALLFTNRWLREVTEGREPRNLQMPSHCAEDGPRVGPARGTAMRPAPAARHLGTATRLPAAAGRPSARIAHCSCQRGDVLQRAVHAAAESCQASGAECRRLGDFRPLDRNTQDIGEPLHEQLVLRHPAVDLEHGRPQAVGRHGLEQIVGLVDHAVERRACDLAAARGARQSDQGAAGVGIPIAARRVR